MREVVMLKTGWGKPLDPEYIKRWNEMCAEISGFQCKIQRNIGSAIEQADKSTLWIFGDARQIAISCCSYVTHPPNHDTKGLLCAKTRLSPQQRQLSIPRLELIAILISLRLAKSIVGTYRARLKSVFIICDSNIALAWK
ncbi:unnamed protein product [Heligmosomoides polygyrus]|uniref:RNase H domain-containing protein n=1 Tax=Heligmosomoides polygyrus TaxID=6339 RepID=A0A183FI65_HELPZ|nr:unnamed protein product [Heligmosomoides polygyrus]